MEGDMEKSGRFRRVAIVGVEGSGKTVMLAGLGDLYAQPDERGYFLKPRNFGTASYVQEIVGRLRAGQWPKATGADAVHGLDWMLRRRTGARSRPRDVCAISFLDFPGEAYRAAFGITPSAKFAKAALQLRQHVSEADDLIVLVNLRDIIVRGPTDQRVREAMWITNGILEQTFGGKSRERMPRAAIVLSQADSYADTIEHCGGPRGVLARYLPSVANGYGWLDVMAVSSVDATVLDDEGLAHPAPGFTFKGLAPLLDWIVRGNDAETTPRMCKVILAVAAIAVAALVGFLLHHDPTPPPSPSRTAKKVATAPSPSRAVKVATAPSPSRAAKKVATPARRQKYLGSPEEQLRVAVRDGDDAEIRRLCQGGVIADDALFGFTIRGARDLETFRMLVGESSKEALTEFLQKCIKSFGSRSLRCRDRDRLEVVRILLKGGADPNVRNFFGKTALGNAVEYDGDMALVKLLLDNGADAARLPPKTELIKVLYRGNRCLWETNRYALVELLVGHGLDLNAAGWSDETPLAALVQCGDSAGGYDLRMAELLLSHGADPNMRQGRGGVRGSATDMAYLRHGAEKMLALLEKYGGKVSDEAKKRKSDRSSRGERDGKAACMGAEMDRLHHERIMRHIREEEERMRRMRASPRAREFWYNMPP